jgi:hypothetical protein
MLSPLARSIRAEAFTSEGGEDRLGPAHGSVWTAYASL